MSNGETFCPCKYSARNLSCIFGQHSGDCMKRLHQLLLDEDFERAVLLMRAGRASWTDSECFGAQNAQPEDELMLMKEIYLADLVTGESAV